MSHKAILDQIGCNDLVQLVDPAFLHTFNLNPPNQYGVVAKDVPQAITQLRSAGASEFAYVKMIAPQWKEYGENKKNVEIELAFGYSNHQQIEILGPGKNTTLYSDLISSDGILALHHVCVFQKGIEEIERKLNSSGYKTVLSGDMGLKNVYTTRFRYLDTRPTLGFYLELCEHLLFNQHAPPAESLVRFIARRQARFAD